MRIVKFSILISLFFFIRGFSQEELQSDDSVTWSSKPVEQKEEIEDKPEISTKTSSSEEDDDDFFTFEWSSDDEVDELSIKGLRINNRRRNYNDDDYSSDVNSPQSYNNAQFGDRLRGKTGAVKRKKAVRFAFNTDFTFMLAGSGNVTTWGLSTDLGARIKNHYLGVNFYWGFDALNLRIPDEVYYNNTGNNFSNYYVLNEYSGFCYGGGIEYLYHLNLRDIFLTGFGLTAGFWYEDHSVYYMNGYGESLPYNQYPNDANLNDIYFGGPKVNLQIGYKYVYLKAECTLLLGTGGIKPVLNPGLVFVF